MEYQPEYEYEIVPASAPDPKPMRRAASFCAFGAVAQTLIAYGLVVGFSAFISAVFHAELNADWSLIVNTVTIDLIAMPLAWLLLLRRTPRNALREAEAPQPLSFRAFFFYLPCAFVLMYAGALTGRLVGLLFGKGLNDVVDGMIGSVNPWISLLCAGIIGPVAEELFFRKAMIDRLSGFHPADAIVYSALLFGLVHGNLTQFLYAFPLGLLLGFVYYRTQNIGHTILLHVAVNLLGGIVPQVINLMEEAGAGNNVLKLIASLATALYSVMTIVLCVFGIIHLIRRRRQFFTIRPELPRFRRPFYINAGFIVACVVFTVLFVLAEIVT